MDKLVDSVKKSYKIKAAIIIQQKLKGYLVSKRMENIIIDIKLNKNLEFLTNMNNKFYEGNQIIIAYHWRKKLRRMRELKDNKKNKKRSIKKDIV